MKNINLIKGIILPVLLLVGCFGLSGQVIYSYTSNTTGAYATIATNMTASGLTRVNGATAPSGPCGSGFSSTNFPSTTTYSTSLAAVEIVMTPNTGYLINATKFTLPIRRSGTGPSLVRYAYSTDGGSTWIDQGTNQAPNNAGCGSMNNASWTVSISGASSLRVRVYAFGSSNPSAGTFQLLNVSIEGTVTASGPLVNTPSVSNIIDTSATLSANLASNGGTTILERGFVWSTATNPLSGGSGVTTAVVSGSGTGTFTATPTNFPAGTKIFFKGYARNSSGYFYTTEVSFTTQSREPSSYPSSFTATAISKNAITLNWTQVTGANGYLIIQRLGVAPTGVPADKTAYTLSQAIGDGNVAGIITNGATTTTTVSGLLQGTRYYYTLFPFGYNGVDVTTYNYRTIPTIPLANDSTLGFPTSNLSTIEFVTGFESLGIPANNNQTVTLPTDGTQVFKLRIKDGGATMNDPDDLPTTFTSINISNGPRNDVSLWVNNIQSAGLFDDSTNTLVKNGTISNNLISFSAINVTAQDDNYRDYSVRITLKKAALIERDTFQFRVSSTQSITTNSVLSSQKQTFVYDTDSSKNTIDVIAYKLRFLNQPPSTIEPGNYITGSIQIEAVDSFNVRDLDFTSPILLNATAGNLFSAPRSTNAVKGVAEFDTVRFFKAAISDSLVATSGGLVRAVSNRVDVVNSRLSDIIADGSFTYPQNIHHPGYNGTGAITNTNSLEVMSYLLRDGGNTGDNDFEPTVLNSLTLNTTNSYLIRSAALFVNSTKVAQADSFITVGANKQLVFTGMNITAPDDDSARFSLRVTFKDSIIDNDNFSFTVAAAGFDSTNSFMALANAGGVVSSTTGNNNRVEIDARFQVFTQQPTNVSEGSIQFPSPSLTMVDSLGNIDNAIRSFTLQTVGTSVFDFRAQTTVNSVNGIVTFDKLIYNTPAVNNTIKVITTGLDSVISIPFEVMKPTWFRSVKSGNWSDNSVWESSNNYGSNWTAATTSPDYNLAGQTTVRTGHTVQMDGLTAVANTIDELIVENGAILITPQGSLNKIAVANGPGTDFLLEGKLLHANPVAGIGIDIMAPATMQVKKGGVVELAAYGDAAHWAGNSNITFEDSAIYIHNTPITNTIGAVTMFPNATAAQVPVFRIAQNYTYPGTFVNPLGKLAINGLLSVDANTTLTIKGGGERLLRNGITGAGNITIADSSKVIITGAAQLSGTGKINVNHANALFQIGTLSTTTLTGNKEITTNANNGIEVAGILNGLTNGLNGNGNIRTKATATVITAHPQGLAGIFNTTGNKNYNAGTDYTFNGTAAQVSGNSTSLTASKIWVDNTIGFTLSNAVTVTDTLFIGKSNINTSTAALLTINKGGVINGYTPTSFISGPLNMWAESPALVYYPVGKSNFGPVTYQSTANASWVTIEYVNNTPHINGYDTTKKGEGLAKVTAKEYWKINTSNPTNGRVEIPYTTNSAVTGVDTLNLRVVSWNGTRWISEGPVGRKATANAVKSDGLHNNTVFTIGIDSSCTVPAVPAFTNLNVCIGNTVNLSATATGTVRWFINATDSLPFAAGTIINLGILSKDTIFYTEAKNIGCYSNRVAYPVKINAVPALPTITGGTQLCYNATAQLTTGATGTNNWYNSLNSTTPGFTGNVFTTGQLKGDTTFFLENAQNGCASPRAQVTVNVRNEVVTPFSSGAQICSGTTGVIDATANNTIRWFASATATTPIFSGNRLTTPVLTADSNYYIEAFDGTCPSTRIAVLADVLPLPAAPVLTQPAVCSGNSAQITATGTGTIYWYNDSTSASVNSGATFSTAPLFANRTWYANQFDGKCFSPKTTATVLVFNTPNGAAITLATNIQANVSTPVQTTGTAQNIEWNFGADATPSTAIGAGPHNVKWTTQGVKTVTLKMWNGNTAVACSTEVLDYITVGAGVGIEEINGAIIAVYPNPASSILNLDINFKTAQTGTIVMMDISGKTVNTSAFANTENVSAQVDVSALTKGVYMLKVITANGVSVQKVIVQ